MALSWYAGTATIWQADGAPDGRAIAWDLFAVLREVLPLPSTMEIRAQWYRRGFAADDGSYAVLYEGVGSARDGVMATVRQSVFERIGPERSWALFETLARRLRCSRVDLASDRTSALSPAHLYGLWPAARSRSRPANVVLMQNHGGGQTLTIGSRQSDRFLRVYAKGEGVRHELELKHEVAQGVVERLLAGVSLETVWAAEYGRVVQWPV